MDGSIVKALNDWFTANGFRADLARFLAIAPLVAIAALVVIAWLVDWGRQPERRAVLVVGILGALLAFAINLGLGHLYFRPRPFLVLHVQALLPHPPDSSLYSDHLAIAGALSGALLVARRRWGLAAVGLALIEAIGRVGAAVHYPSDVLVAFLIGGACFALLLPLRERIAPLVGMLTSPETAVMRREREQGNFLFRHGPVVAAAILALTAGLAYGIRTLQDHGRIEAGVRAEAFLHPQANERPPSEFSGTSIATIAGGHYRASHAAVVGQVTQVTHELDGDIHLRVEGDGAFVVLEIIPELPLDPPHLGQ